MDSIANKLFLTCVKDNNIEEFKALLKSYKDLGIDVNFQNKDGNTALMLSVERGNIEIVKLLLNCKDDNNSYIVNPNIQNNNGETVLMIAVENGDIEIVKLLLNCKDANNSYIVNPNIQNNNSESALLMAVLKGYTEISEFLIRNEEEGRYPVNIDLEDADGLTALDHARRNNDYIKRLLKIKMKQNEIPKSDKYDVLNVLRGVKKHYNAKNLILTMNVDGTNISYNLE